MAVDMDVAETNAPVEVIAERLETPFTDDRKYRVIKLPNQLEVLLAHDADVDMASAALDVNVGNFSDGGIPGVAHAIEHLLFMGSKKYPSDKEFKAYIASHSGGSNASTRLCSTNYHFQITAERREGSTGVSDTESSPFYGALDRFAQFFIEPLFSASTLDREIHAVDSEFKLKFQSDDRRLFQLGRSLSNPKHPYHGFSTGNLQTLKVEPEEQGLDMRAKFIEFYEKYYSANRMKLCVLGKESLDVLQEWVYTIFSSIPNKNLPQNRWETEALWTENQLPMLVYTKPIMDLRKIVITFPLLDEEFLLESLPSFYISRLFGHQGPGSLMTYLKSKSWVNSLSAGTSTICPGTPIVFHVDMHLSEQGLENYEEIIKFVFHYVSLLRGDPSRLSEFASESRQLAELHFKFKQKINSQKFTSEMCSLMQTPLIRKRILGGQKRPTAFNDELVGKALNRLRPDNFRLMLVSQVSPGEWDKQEKWYGTEYKEAKLSDTFLADLWEAFEGRNRPAALHLPGKNLFIPDNLDVEKTVGTPDTPRLLRNDEVIRAWYKKDDTFLVPKATIYTSLHSPLIYVTADSEAYAMLLVELVDDALEEYSYDARLAGLRYSVSLNDRGICVEVSGYNDKLPVLLERVLTTVRDLEIREDRLAVVKEYMTRYLRNSELQKPHLQVAKYAPWLIAANPKHLLRQLVPGVAHATVESLGHFHKQVMARLFVETYCHGNIAKEEALRVTTVTESILVAKRAPLPPDERPLIPRSLVIPPGINFRYSESLRDAGDVNNCVSYYLQARPWQTSCVPPEADSHGTLRAMRARLHLLANILRPRVFAQLRTTEQLGYVVRTRLSSMHGALWGLVIEIQSERSCEYLESRIDAFLGIIAGEKADTGVTSGSNPFLHDMTEEAFEKEKKGAVDKLLEKPKNMDQESDKFWARIKDEYYDFERVSKDATYIQAITKHDLIQFVQEFLSPLSVTRASLTVYLRAQKQGPKSGNDQLENQTATALSRRIDITDIRDFKAGLVADAGPQPVQDLSTLQD